MNDPDIERIVQQAWSDFIHQPKAEEWSQKAAACHCARRAAELAVAKERERCAKVLDDKREAVAKPRSYELAHYCMGLEDGAAAIRAGKEVGSV